MLQKKNTRAIKLILHGQFRSEQNLISKSLWTDLYFIACEHFEHLTTILNKWKESKTKKKKNNAESRLLEAKNMFILIQD